MPAKNVVKTVALDGCTFGEQDLGIYVALVHVDREQPLSRVDDFLAQLTGPEQTRARSISVALHKQRYVLSHAAMHRLVREEFGEDRRRKFETSPNGSPSFTQGPYVSLSRAEGWAAIGICRDCPIGVDVAVNTPRDGEYYANKYPGLETRLRFREGQDNTLQFLRAWTELEAIAKLKSIPLEVLLATSSGTPTCLMTFFNADLVVTVGCESEHEINFDLCRWQVDGVLERRPADLIQLAGL